MSQRQTAETVSQKISQSECGAASVCASENVVSVVAVFFLSPSKVHVALEQVMWFGGDSEHRWNNGTGREEKDIGIRKEKRYRGISSIHIHKIFPLSAGKKLPLMLRAVLFFCRDALIWRVDWVNSRAISTKCVENIKRSPNYYLIGNIDFRTRKKLSEMGEESRQNRNEISFPTRLTSHQKGIMYYKIIMN